MWTALCAAPQVARLRERGAAFVVGSETAFAVATSASESIEHFAAEEDSEDAHLEPEFAGRDQPTAANGCMPAPGDDAVHVRMEGESAVQV